jgi:hypothetical protein
MIHNLSQALKAILEDELPKPLLDSVDIVFDRPDDKFNPIKMTVDLFLYDIRENVELRNNEPSIKRQNGQVIIRRSPLRVACSYLITAWPVSGSSISDLPKELPLQEHYLLSHILSIFSKHPTITDKFLKGSNLEGQEPPLPLITAQTEGFKNPAEFWTAIGNRMRPSFTVTATISLEDAMPEITQKMVITKDIRLGQRTSHDEEIISPATKEEFFHIGGRITNDTNEPIKNATVMVVELGIITTTDTNGLYTLGPMKRGEYKLRVRSDVTSKDFDISVPAPSGSNYDLK